MPSQGEIDSLQEFLEAADEATLADTLDRAGYHVKGEDRVFKAPNGRTVNINMDTRFREYVELTGHTAMNLKSRIIADVCGNAHARPDQFGAVFRAANLPKPKPISDALEALAARQNQVADSSERSAKSLEVPFWRKGGFVVGTALTIVAIVISLLGYKCATTGDGPSANTLTQTQPRSK